MTRKTFGRASIAGASAATIALMGVGFGVGVAPAAFAAEGDTNAACQDLSEISTVDLTVHKYAGTKDDSKPNNGLKLDEEPDRTPLDGVVFSYYKVKDVDLTTNEGQAAAQELYDNYKTNPSKLIPDNKVDAPQDFAPTKAGKTTKTLEKGIYLVVEKSAPRGYIKAAPFLVSLPMTNPTDRTCWNSDVHVYPKNSETSINKSVKDDTIESAGTGNENSRVQYTVKSEIPPVSDEGWARYEIIDPLSSKLQYIPGEAQNTEEVKIVSQSGEETNLQLGTDYEVVQADGSDGVKWVTVRFLQPGLDKLKANPNGKVEWTLKAKVLDTQGTTDIHNYASTIQVPKDSPTDPNYPSDPNDPTSPPNPNNPQDPNNPPFNPEEPNNPFDPDKPTSPDDPGLPGLPSKPVESKFGKAIFKKISSEDQSALNGAKFELYRSNSGECSADDLQSENQVSVDGKNTWTSGEAPAGTEESQEEGKIVIDGLQLNDFRNGEAVPDSTEAYCLKEVEAPEGYELLPDPVKFQLTQDQPSFEEAMEVKNLPKNGGFNLPLTGGAGIAPLVTIGGLLILGSGAYVAASNRKKKNQA